MIDPLREKNPIPSRKEAGEKKPQTSRAQDAPDQMHLGQTSLGPDTIADLFHDRDQALALSKPPEGPLGHSQGHSQAQEAQESTQGIVKETSGDEDINSPGAPKKDSRSTEAASTEETQGALQSLKEELTKTHKRLVENQQYGRQNAQRLKNALKLTKAFVEEGSLSEEEASKLMETLEHDEAADDYNHPTHLFGRVLATANKELDNIRKYTDDDHLDDKVAAFDYFLLVSSPKERDQALEDLTDLMENPLTLAKKMLSIGQDYQTYYRDMKAAGSLHGLITKKDQDILNLRKNLEKVTKKLAQFEDYDKLRYRIDDQGEERSGWEEDGLPNDTISALFQSRDAIRHNSPRR